MQPKDTRQLWRKKGIGKEVVGNSLILITSVVVICCNSKVCRDEACTCQA